jgi:molybdate transport system substrate-binding protein
MIRRSFIAIVAGLLLLGAETHAADVHVLISGGFSEAYRALVPQFEKTTGHKVHTAYGPSMGSARESIPNRLGRGEPADVVIMVGTALDGLAAKQKVVVGSRVDLARSGIGAAVRKDAPRPDISTVAGLRRALLDAKSVAYSDSASGIYIEGELLPRLGIAEQMKGRTKRIVAERIGNVVARGDAELGFQQISELKPVAGIVLLGPLPAEVQKITVFSAGVAAASRQPEAAQALIAFLSSKEAAPVVNQTGLEPVAKGS